MKYCAGRMLPALHHPLALPSATNCLQVRCHAVRSFFTPSSLGCKSCCNRLDVLCYENVCMINL